MVMRWWVCYLIAGLALVQKLVFFSFENCLGRRRYGEVQPKSSKALHEIVLEVFLIGLLQVVSTEIAVGVAGLQHGVCDVQHGVSDGHHCSFDTSSRCQAPELG